MMKNIETMMQEIKNHMDGMSIDLVDSYGGNVIISDAIMEYADTMVDDYNGDIIKFISEHVEEVNDTIKEYGWKECGGDLYTAGRCAEFRLNEQTMLDDLQNIIELCILEFFQNLGHTEINANLWEYITDYIDYDGLRDETFDDATAYAVDAWEAWKEEAEDVELPGVA